MIALVLLWLVVFTMPWEKSIVLTGVGTLTKVLGVLAAVSAIPAWRKGLSAPAWLLAAAFVLWCAATWLWSLDQTATAVRVSTLVQLLIMAIVVLAVCDTPQRTRALLCAWVGGCGVASLLTVVRYLEGTQTYYRRFAAPGFDPNDLGLTVALAIPIALYLRGRWLAVLPLIAAAVLLTASRTAWVASFAGVLFILFAWKRAELAERIAGVAMAVVLALGPVMLAPEPARKRIATTLTEVARGTLHDRTTIWKAGLRAWRQWPLRGAGAGAYPEAVRPLIGVPPRAGHVYVAHNVFLSVVVETGLIGFGLFLLWGLSVLIMGWALHPGERALWAAVLGVWLCAAMTLTWEHRKPTWLMPGLIAAMWTRSMRGGEA